MARSLLLISIALAVTLVACAPTTAPAPSITRNPSPPASPSVTAPIPQELSVLYHRSGGFAGTDDTWSMAADGTVAHQGQTTGTPEQLTATQITELTAAIRAANFMSLENSYVPKDTCCDRYLYEITVTVNGQSKTVRTIDASPTAPVEVMHLIDTLNQLVITAK